MTAPEQSATEHAATIRKAARRLVVSAGIMPQNLDEDSEQAELLAALDALKALAERADAAEARAEGLRAELDQVATERDHLYNQEWPWEWVIATKEKERREAAEAALADATALSHEHYEAYVSEVAERQKAEARVKELEACWGANGVRAVTEQKAINAQVVGQLAEAVARAEAAEARVKEMEARMLLAKSRLDWCIGYLDGYDQDTNEHFIRGKLIEARAALAAGSL